MKTKPQMKTHLFTRRLDSLARSVALLATGAATLLAANAMAGSFISDFNPALPLGTAVYGNSAWSATGGYTNSGCIKLTTAVNSQTAGFIITNDLDLGTPVVSFTASFKALIGGGNAADGISFNFASDLPLGTITEEGAGTGLTVEFDTFNNAPAGSDSIGIDLKAYGSEIFQSPVPLASLRANTFVDVFIQQTSDGSVQVFYDNIYAYTNQANLGISSTTAGLFGFGARTGGQNDNHFIDNLQIVTRTNPMPLATYFAPIGRSARGDAPLYITLTDYGAGVDTSTISLKLDGTTVTPTVSYSAPTTTISYTNPALFASGSSHTVSLVYADTASPTPNTNTLNYGFSVATYAVLPTNLVADVSYANLSSPGFFIRYSQIAEGGSRAITLAEMQLANLLIDPSTGLPFDNLAATNPVDGTFTYFETNVLNYGFPAGSTGDFPNDTTTPGMPGITTGTGSSYAMDALAYLHLSPGLYQLGVNSSDGFKLTVADGPDIFATQEAIFDGVRAAADSTVTFSVSLDGYYPFRLVYFTGDPTYSPAPGTALPNVEFFNVDRSGTPVLINDTNVAGYIPAFTAAKTKPYIRSISPASGETGVPGNAVVNAVLVDGTLKVQTNTIQFSFNGSVVSPLISSNSSVTTITYDPPGDLAPNSTNTVQLAFTDSGANRRTNTWQFVAANIFQEIWNIAPGAVPYVTTGSTERGLAYNPKTGHLILVSRAVGGLEIEILNSSTGAKLGTMDKTGIAGGAFILNQVDVADDGVIYASNLATDSATANLRIYRWANEAASPVMIYNDNPANPGNLGTTQFGMRIGDVLVVRGSGAGTQILLGQNTAIAVSGNPDIGGGTNAVLFTTIDGTNFTAKRIPISGISNGDLRLGLAFGCGNTLFGKQTGSPLRYASFNPAAGTGALINSYNVVNPVSSATIGPLGFDVFDQRLVGNATSASAVLHSMNLYDDASLAPTPANNSPLDTRVFHTSNTAFGTGAVDFSPDETQVFALDTGNGIIAFTMAPKPAAPSICAQPQNFIVKPTNSVGFMDVMAIGAPQAFQWRFHGLNAGNVATNLLSGTNRTVDIYNMQQTNLGWYSVVITNTLGRATSSVALLDIQMIITNQPTDLIATQGTPVTFGVGVDGGARPLGYQWQKNGVNIGGATTSTYTIASPDFPDGAYLGYSVLITDALTQAVTSASVTLNVEPAVAPAPGTGTGLLGMYYTNAVYATTTPPNPFTGFPVANRVDPTVNFDFGTGSFDPVNFLSSTDYFQVRWVGQVQPLYSQPYTFFVTSDDGQRLWVNGTKLVDDWATHGPTERSASISLLAGQKYDVTYEMFEKTVGAVAKLWWWSSSQLKTNVPMEQLYPGAGPLIPTFTTSVSNGTNLVLNWVGTCVLQSATNVTGPWAPLTTNAGPFTMNVNAPPQRFFRLLSQEF